MNTCIVIPCYNEAKRIDTEAFIKFIHTGDFFFLFVNDGSTDDTLSVLDTITTACPDKASVISVPENGGKAEAIRFGINHALKEPGYSVFGFLDSDLATPLNEIKNLVNYLQNHDRYAMIMAIRLKRLGSNVLRSLRRHYLGRVFATMVSILLHLPTYDTQCGAKVFKRDLAENLFRDPFLSPWFFDVELLFRIKTIRGRDFAIDQIYEFPLMTWNEMQGSKIGLSTYLKAPFELLKIWWAYRD